MLLTTVLPQAAGVRNSRPGRLAPELVLVQSSRPEYQLAAAPPPKLEYINKFKKWHIISAVSAWDPHVMCSDRDQDVFLIHDQVRSVYGTLPYTQTN
jgi:hypothetical protein